MAITSTGFNYKEIVDERKAKLEAIEEEQARQRLEEQRKCREAEKALRVKQGEDRLKNYAFIEPDSNADLTKIVREIQKAIGQEKRASREHIEEQRKKDWTEYSSKHPESVQKSPEMSFLLTDVDGRVGTGEASYHSGAVNKEMLIEEVNGIKESLARYPEDNYRRVEIWPDMRIDIRVRCIGGCCDPDYTTDMGNYLIGDWVGFDNPIWNSDTGWTHKKGGK